MELHLNHSTCPDSSTYPTKATESMIPWAITSGHSRPVRNHTAPNTSPIATLPSPAPMP